VSGCHDEPACLEALVVGHHDPQKDDASLHVDAHFASRCCGSGWPTTVGLHALAAGGIVGAVWTRTELFGVALLLCLAFGAGGLYGAAAQTSWPDAALLLAPYTLVGGGGAAAMWRPTTPPPTTI
jgi:hypothetical protein